MNHPNITHRVLALDLATVTGWAVVANGIITSGSQDFARYKGAKHKPAEHPGQPFASFRRWLHEKLREEKPAAIVYEEVMRFPYAMQAHSFCGYRALMYEAATIFSLPCYRYSPATIKLFWCGKGNADKERMVAMTRNRCPDVDLTDDNEADALAVLHLHLSTITHL